MMATLCLKQLSVTDGKDIYEMLQTIGNEENAFNNPVSGMSYSEYKKWLIEQDDCSKGINIPEGYVCQTCYWLFKNDKPVGFGKIRHALTNRSRIIGGNIGYAISNAHRGEGLGKKLLSMLIKKADELGVDEKLLTVEKYNYASKKVIEANGGRLFAENDQRWYFNI